MQGRYLIDTNGINFYNISSNGALLLVFARKPTILDYHNPELLILVAHWYNKNHL